MKRMKRYNLSEIMKRAHRTYKSNFRMGRRFGEILKESWEIAKSEVKFREEREAKFKAMREAMKDRKPARNGYNDLDIPQSAFYNPYSTGRMGAHYVGD